MRTRIALLLAGALVLGACSQSGDASGSDATATDSPSAAASDAPTAAATPELVSEDLPDGVVATVGETEIGIDQVQERIDLVKEIPEVKQRLEGENAEQTEDQLTAQIVGQLVVQRLVLNGAADEGVEVGDDAVEEERQALEEEAGGEEAFAKQLATAGVPPSQLPDDLRASIAFEAVTDKLLAEAPAPSETPSAAATEDATGSEAPTDAATQDPRARQIQQQWLQELISSVDIVVDEEFGAWNPATGQVQPA